MGQDDENEGSNLSAPRTISELEAEIRLYIQKMEAYETAQQDLQRRVKWLTEREASKADHVLRLATSVEQDRSSRDKQTEALLVTIQRLSGTIEGLEYLRGAVDLILAKQKALMALTGPVDQPTPPAPPEPLILLPGQSATPPPGAMVPLTTMENVVEAMRDITASHRIHRHGHREPNAPTEIDGGGDSGDSSSAHSGRTATLVSNVRRVLRDFFRAPTAAQFWLFAIVFVIALAWVASIAIKEGWHARELESTQKSLPVKHE